MHPRCDSYSDEFGNHEVTCKLLNCEGSASWKRSHDHVLRVLDFLNGYTNIQATFEEKKVPRQRDGPVGDAWLDVKVGTYKALILDFVMTHPRRGSDGRTGAGRQGDWVRVDDLDSVLHSKQQKHMAYHQMNIEYATLAATTYGRINDDFVRVLWFMASRSNRDWEETEPVQFDEETHRDRLKRDSISYTFLRSTISTAIAKATAARLVHDILEDDLGVALPWSVKNWSQRDINDEIQSVHLLPVADRAVPSTSQETVKHNELSQEGPCPPPRSFTANNHSVPYYADVLSNTDNRNAKKT